MSTERHFYYKITDLHNLAQVESIHALSSAETEPGREGLTDKSVLGLDEAVFFKRMIKTAAVEVFKRIHRRGRGVASGYQFDAPYGEADDGYIIFNLSFPDNFDENLLEPIDTYVLNALIYKSLAEWFKSTRKNYLSEDFEKQYTNQIDQLKSIMEMRTKVSGKAYFFAPYFLNS